MTRISCRGRAWSLVMALAQRAGERAWQATVARATALPEPLLYERVDGEWSFTETLRHLVFATDCWLFRMIRQEPSPYHRWGLAESWLTDPASLGIDPDANPSLSEVLQVRRGRTDAVRDAIADLTAEDLVRDCVPRPRQDTRHRSTRCCIACT